MCSNIPEIASVKLLNCQYKLYNRSEPAPLPAPVQLLTVGGPKAGCAGKDTCRVARQLSLRVSGHRVRLALISPTWVSFLFRYIGCDEPIISLHSDAFLFGTAWPKKYRRFLMGLKTEASGLLMDPKNVQDAQEVPVHKDRLELVKNFLCIVLNVASAVGVVMANKVVFSVFNFKFGTVLTVIHFVVTAFALELLVALKAFPAKSVPIMTIVPLSLSFCGFVVLTNLSLQYNSVGFYQMAKVMTTPCVALIQYFFYSVSFTLPVIATLVVTCVGVIVATFAEVNLSPIGLFFAASSVLVTALYQIVPLRIARPRSLCF